MSGTEVVVHRVRTKYRWPPLQLNFWLFIMLVGSCTILGINSYFITVQNQLRVGIPWYVLLPLLFALVELSWSRDGRQGRLRDFEELEVFSANIFICRYFPYWIASSALAVVFILVMLWLISQRQLLPGIVIMGSFILFILWMVGLIVISIQLWGPSGVNGNCNIYVNGRSYTGPNVNTLAYLEQHSICKYFSRRLGKLIMANLCAGQSWQAQWAFELVGCVFLLWMMIMAYQVYQDDT